MHLTCPVSRSDTISFLIRRFGNILLSNNWLKVIMKVLLLVMVIIMIIKLL